MKKRTIVIGIFILVAVAAVIYFFTHRSKETITQLPEPTTEEKIEERFNLVLPEDVERAELTDVSGGTASGIAARKYENGRFEFTVLADLPDPDSGTYQVALEKDGDQVNLGAMRVAKGGYLLDFNSSVDYSDYNQVKVSLGDKVILEGGF